MSFPARTPHWQSYDDDDAPLSCCVTDIATRAFLARHCLAARLLSSNEPRRCFVSALAGHVRCCCPVRCPCYQSCVLLWSAPVLSVLVRLFVVFACISTAEFGRGWNYCLLLVQEPGALSFASATLWVPRVGSACLLSRSFLCLSVCLFYVVCFRFRHRFWTWLELAVTVSSPGALV